MPFAVEPVASASPKRSVTDPATGVTRPPGEAGKARLPGGGVGAGWLAR